MFIGTTRPYRYEGTLYSCQQCIRDDFHHRFEYEIFVYGGIDMKLALGVRNLIGRHHEIAFPGGIRQK
jgi:hypothetical protein